MKQISQLIAEFDHYNSGAAKQGILSLSRRLSSMQGGRDDGSSKVQGKLCRSSVGIQYEFLKVTPVPFNLDYNHVVFSLCTALNLLYSRFQEESLLTILRDLEKQAVPKENSIQLTTSPDPDFELPPLYYIILTTIDDIDSHLEEWVFDPLLREVTDSARRQIKSELSSLHALRSHLYVTKSPFTCPSKPFIPSESPSSSSYPPPPTFPPPPPPPPSSRA